MRLDDLARDRQTEPRILAEPLAGTIRIEPLEDPLEGMGRNAGTIVLDHDFDALARVILVEAGRPDRDSHDTILAREGSGIVEKVVDHLPEPRIMSHDAIARPVLARRG